MAHVFVLCLIVFLVNNGSLPSWGSSLLPWLFVSVLALGLLAAFLMLSHVVPPHMWLSTHPDADRWSWTFIACSLLLPLLVLIGLQTWFAAPGLKANSSKTVARNERRYGAIIDAGSRGSRIAIFEWHMAGDGYLEVTQLAQARDDEESRVKCPLTNFSAPAAGDTCDCLLDLAARGRKIALGKPGVTGLSPISLWVRATAGVRSKPATEQVRVVEATERCLGKVKDYEWLGTRVITGSEEGAYAWLAVNYLAGKLRGDASSTFGIMEVGGQSAQVAFRVPALFCRIDPNKGGVITVPFDWGPLYVYSMTEWLGKDHMKEALDTDPHVTPGVCANNGNVDACLNWIKNYLCPYRKSSGLTATPCPERSPAIDVPPGMRFAGLSSFQRIYATLGLRGGTLKDVSTTAHSFCGSVDDETANQQRTDARNAAIKDPDGDGKTACLDAPYLAQVADYEWGVPLDKVEPPAQLGADKADWPLGAMIFEALTSGD